MAIEGRLDEFPLPDILQMVAAQGKTGILTIQGRETIVAVSFLTGDVVAADRLDRTVEERLGERLVRDGLVPRDRFTAVRARQEAGQGRLIDLLVAGGELSRGEVLGSLRSTTEELLYDVLRWEQGEFKFYGGEEVSYEEGFEPIAVESLLLRSLEELEEEAAVPAGGAAAAAGATAPPPGPPGAAAAAAPAAAHPGPGAAVAPAAALVPAAAAGAGTEEAPTARRAPALPRWLAPLAAAALAAALLVAAPLAPARFLLPFPWQRDDLRALETTERQAMAVRIDRAAKTFFLLEGRFPDDLGALAALGLLDRADLRDPASGEPFGFRAGAGSYELSAPAAGGAAAARFSEAITDDFLLDPELLRAPAADSDEAPLVLLD